MGWKSHGFPAVTSWTTHIKQNPLSVPASLLNRPFHHLHLPSYSSQESRASFYALLLVWLIPPIPPVPKTCGLAVLPSHISNHSLFLNPTTTSLVQALIISLILTSLLAGFPVFSQASFWPTTNWPARVFFLSLLPGHVTLTWKHFPSSSLPTTPLSVVLMPYSPYRASFPSPHSSLTVCLATLSVSTCSHLRVFVGSAPSAGSAFPLAPGG